MHDVNLTLILLFCLTATISCVVSAKAAVKPSARDQQASLDDDAEAYQQYLKHLENEDGESCSRVSFAFPTVVSYVSSFTGSIVLLSEPLSDEEQADLERMVQNEEEAEGEYILLTNSRVL